MALKKPMVAPNGAECEYHRVDMVELDVNTMRGSFVVGSYPAEQHARLTRAPAWTTRYDNFQATSTLTAHAEAYEVLKTLPEWNGAEDV